MNILCVTGNTRKFTIGATACARQGVTLVQHSIDVDEVQGDNYRYIAEQKARAAYETIKQPLVVTDDAWEIHGLQGFPGAYMKHVNQWFTVEDFLRLTRGLDDRSVSLHQQVAYYDGETIKVFEHTVHGTLLTEARGKQGHSWAKVVRMDGDNGRSMSEQYYDDRPQAEDAQGESSTAEVWHAFATWYGTR